MMGIVNGTIPVAGHPVSKGTGTAGIVTRADFNGDGTEQKRILSVLRQLIKGGTLLDLLCLPHWMGQFLTMCGTSHLRVMTVPSDSLD